MGTMGKAIHPATMFLLDEFVAVCTQLKIERPGKAAGICSCDSIEGPIVKLINDDVVKVQSLEEAKKIKLQLKEILFLGDMLIPVGDFKYTAHPLVPVGYCEEWWRKELEKAGGKEKFKSAWENPRNVGQFEAIKISEELLIPLHPEFTHYYTALEKEELVKLVKETLKARKKESNNKNLGIEFENQKEIKNLLEKIGLPHKVEEGKIFVGEKYAFSFYKTLGLEEKNEKEVIETIEKSENVLHALNRLSGLKIRDKGGTFIGARMGRPEASKARKMIGNPNILFPIGLYGGNTRSINKAIETASEKNNGFIEVEVAAFECPNCKEIISSPFCRKCNKRTVPIKICKSCGKETEKDHCPKCASECLPFSKRKINLAKLMKEAEETLGIRAPDLVKGVKGIINEGKIAEPLEKGILRAKNDLHIFRDATIRYEVINAPLTHFKAKEIGVGVERLKELGYEKDIEGKKLENEEQILEIFPQDLVIHEEAADFFLRVSQFIDELLEKFYKKESIFNYSRREDLIGELLLGLAPHTSAAIIGRVIGFTKARACFAHPYFHQTKRRNIDGDQDSLMLLMDALLNFSQSYLPGSRGGRMDAPLVFTVALKPTEIDEEVYSMETCSEYPLELYEKSQEMIQPDGIEIETVRNRLGRKEQYNGLGFTHNTKQFDEGPKTSKYIQLQSMEDKMNAQARLQKIIRAVELKDSLERVLMSHFMPDIVGNTRAFSRQTFRCTNCNTRYRRIPLSGKCTSCKEGNIILTIAEGSVRKYLDIAKNISKTYGLSDYLLQRIELIEEEINSVFKNEKVEQKKLLEFV